MSTISAVVLTKNEGNNIQDCLESLRWCDEIIVVDDYSKDKTIAIVKKSGAKIYERKLNNDFASQRNFGLEKAKSDWVLFIDADERVSKALAQEILHSIKKWEGLLIGFYFYRRDFMWGRELKHGEAGCAKLLRLARKGAGKWKRAVHETWDISGNIGTFHEYDGVIKHYPHPTLREFVADIERYSTIHAQENYKEGKISNIFKIIWYPKLKFFQNYFLKLGFLDGPQGFMVAMLMSFHSYLAWSKLWVLQKRTKNGA